MQPYEKDGSWCSDDGTIADENKIVVQIVLGATQISFGIALTVAQEDFKKLTVNSGVYFWIGILLLFSGASLVEMEKREYPWLEKLCLFVNLLVSGASVIAIILHGTEIGKETEKEDPCDEMDRYYCSNAGKILLYGLNSVFIILSLLELAVSLTAVVIIVRSTRQKFYRQMVST
uniref:Uncharacterized protein n=1 Tax=Sphaerodactylus townsendi TaxID=933632 RepID=A0ACB8G220_9SAUR